MTILKRLLLGSAMYVPFSRIKTCLYKRSGAEIGRNVHMAPGVAILCEDMRRVDIGDECSIGLNVRIRCGAFALGEHTKIASGACVDGASAVTIGRQVYIGHKALLDCWDNIVIEDRVQVSPGAFILTHDSSRHYISGEAVRSGPTVLRENSYVGAGAIVLPGVEVGRCAIIGAGAVVTRNVPDNGMAVGNPATVRMQHSGRRSA
jgi:acetyltransferase-like isoleucine patch superfamily enzyme